MNFTTVLEHRDVSIWGLGDSECVESCRFVIKWGVELETREWGVKDCYVRIDDITGEYDVLNYDTEREETRTFDFEPFKKNLRNEVQWDEHDQLQINALDIDFSTNALEVS